MKEKILAWKNPVIALFILILLVVAGYMYSNRSKESDELLSGTEAGDGAAAVDGDLLRTLGKLRKLRLDTSIFNDPVWQSLEDFGQTLSPEPKGRTNPFAPLSSSAPADGGE